LECRLLKSKKRRRRGEMGYVCDAIFKLTDALGFFEDIPVLEISSRF
jgi:hypothetical protein